MALVLVLRQQVWLRFAATIAFAGLMGVTAAALLRYPLGSIDQNFWGVAGGLALGIAAALLFVLGLGSAVRTDRVGHRGRAGGAGRQSAVGVDQCARDVARRAGERWASCCPRAPPPPCCGRPPTSAVPAPASAILVLSCWAIAGTDADCDRRDAPRSNSYPVGLDDRDALQTLRAAVDAGRGDRQDLHPLVRRRHVRRAICFPRPDPVSAHPSVRP